MTPEILLAVPLVTGGLARLAPRVGLSHAVSAVGALVTAIVGLALAWRVFTAGPMSGGGYFAVDALGAFVVAVVVVIAASSAIYSIVYLRHDVQAGEIQREQIGWYYLWFHLFVTTMLAVCVLNNLGLMWAAVEATTLTSALLVGFYRRQTALEAAWKYLIICTVGITLALFGILLLYYTAAHVLGEGAAALDWTAVVAVAARLDPSIVKLSFLFVLVGYGTKAGLAPLHTWLPDAHSQAPSPVSAVLSGVLLSCALYAILRFHVIAVHAVGPDFSSNLLVLFGVFSVAVAVPFVLVQHDLKRLLAYSSVEHIGLIAAAVGIGGPLGLFGGMLHLANHAIAKALLFFLAGELTQRYGTKAIGRIRGAVQVMPVTGSALLLGAFAITGAPPFGLFLSEFSIVTAGFANGKGIVSVMLLAGIALVFAGLLYHVSRMVFGETPKRLDHGHVEAKQPIRALVLGVPILTLTVLGVSVPAGVTQAVQQVAIVLGGGR